jgi:protein tyrosine/serine phosphatase
MCATLTPSRLVDLCIDLVDEGNKLYIHCIDGRDKTGVVVAILLGRLYSLNSAKALRYTQLLYDTCRPELPAGLREECPRLGDQVQQVRLTK